MSTSVRQAPTHLIGDSPAMRDLKLEIEQVAASDAKVLITGDSGVGKELVAQAVHSLSARAHRPFLAVNCAGMPETLLESELFGHTKGSFTGAYRDRPGKLEMADTGTVFLDEIGEMTLRMQGLLLRFLETGELQKVGSDRNSTRVNVRVIAATNRNLEQAMLDSSFRQDLYYRLNVIRVVLPPLRERREDIPALVTHFLRRFNRRFHRDIRGITPDAMAALMAFDFPGNVRELENLVERAYAMGARDQITLADLPSLTARAAGMPVISGRSLPTLAEVEKDLILRALAMLDNDKEEAARALGISRRTIYRRLKEYGKL